jgi:hypothetical protein
LGDCCHKTRWNKSSKILSPKIADDGVSFIPGGRGKSLIQSTETEICREESSLSVDSLDPRTGSSKTVVEMLRTDPCAWPRKTTNYYWLWSLIS